MSPREPWRDTRGAEGAQRAGYRIVADLWALGTALGRAQARMVHCPPGSIGERLAVRAEARLVAEAEARDAAAFGLALLGEPEPGTPAGRRHGYELARLAWESARRTCVECGADCGVSVDACDRCGYPVCRACGPLQVTDAGDVRVTCRQCDGIGGL